MAGDFDLTITGGQVVTPEKVIPATVAVAEGRIAGIFDAGERPSSRDHMDARGLHILPGLIDTHVHIRAPARPDREDFVSGTSAAAAGGITTLLEMPISDPPVNSAAVLSNRMTQLEPHALIDFGLYGSISPDNMEEIPRMAEAGAIALKTFMTLPPPGRE
ncbi:MAG: amidohydrolase family protein, partial [Caldilineaceae bacterium]|nr:amidohydrolase family protein [Caldilineaceae bacterium]